MVINGAKKDTNNHRISFKTGFASLAFFWLVLW
jgi:hypothetical protein